MTLLITIRVDEDATGYLVASDLKRRFGDDACEVYVVDTDDDEVDEDEDEVDPEMVLTILQGAAQRMGDRPEARQLADLVHALQAPPPAQVPRSSSDNAPPRGMPRPELIPRPNSTRKSIGNTPRRDEAFERVRDAADCPTCGALKGEFCHGKGWRDGAQTYGYQHMHQDRIGLLDWPQA